MVPVLNFKNSFVNVYLLGGSHTLEVHGVVIKGQNDLPNITQDVTSVLRTLYVAHYCQGHSRPQLEKNLIWRNVILFQLKTLITLIFNTSKTLLSVF